MNDLSKLWSELKYQLESTKDKELIAASVSLMVREGDVVSMQCFFFPQKDEVKE